MTLKELRASARMRTATLVAITTCLAVLATAEQAHAIPTFARKYRTSCITCHTVFPKLNDTGEAFRRNGYQFPTNEDILVKDEPIQFGGDAYKDMFPDSIWPSDMPTLPPVFIRAQLREDFSTDPKTDGLKWRQDFPHELVLGGAGTFGSDISFWYEIEWEPVDNDEEPPVIERAFVQFSNLFAWSEDEDENGMRQGHCWINLPRHAMNLRIGRMEPQVLPHYWSIHNRPGIEQYLHNSRKTGNGDNTFKFESAQSAAVELHGVIQQYNSYVVGFANGGLVATEEIGADALDDNNHKDVYFRVARKWFGFPLDGVLGEAEPLGDAQVRAQNADEDDEMAPAGLDFWRAVGFETGFFGWWGEAKLTNPGGDIGEDFRRLGVDARLQWFDLDLMAMFMWGHDEFAGLTGAGKNLGGEDFYLYGIAADYMVKPWIMAQCRYEELAFNEDARQGKEEGRVIPGVIFLIRQNMKLQAEWVIDTTGMDTGGRAATDEARLQLDFAF